MYVQQIVSKILIIAPFAIRELYCDLCKPDKSAGPFKGLIIVPMKFHYYLALLVYVDIGPESGASAQLKMEFGTSTTISRYFRPLIAQRF